MIRKATENDIPAIARTYDELFSYESVNGSGTNWREGVYPTAAVPEKRVPMGEMFVLDEDGVICGSMVLNGEQAAEYGDIPWAYEADADEVLVIHTICVPPRLSGHGYGRAMVNFAVGYAREHGKKVIRLDTYEGNAPARAFYEKMGFRFAGVHDALHEGVISEVLAYLEYRL